MYPIRNKKDARMWYEFLLFANEQGAPRCDPRFSDLKRELRKFSHKPPFVYKIDGHEIYARLINERGIDGYVELIRFPKEIRDRETAEKFFDSYIYMECRPSMYDCTGDSFTNWRKIFVRRGEYWCYHSVSFDL